MIASLQGILVHKAANHVVIDVHGVGYGVIVPLGTFYRLPDTGSPVHLVIDTHVAQDAVRLFGFLDHSEKELFRLLISVSGIGPRLAINILSGISPEDLSDAISGGNLGRLVGIPGVGKKTAERILFELKDKVGTVIPGRLPAGSPDAVMKEDALSALVNLGYKDSIAKKAIDRVCAEKGREVPLEVLLPEALKVLSG
ncbi:MAG: Holliday junction branch migration protein RuvA [Deltaproteobacteria bacterium]|nr:Holliday junction branch migration protein RuvA [Deltaproteobacteria bacterium]